MYTEFNYFYDLIKHTHTCMVEMHMYRFFFGVKSESAKQVQSVGNGIDIELF